MTNPIDHWEIKDGKIIVIRWDPTKTINYGDGNYDEYYYEEECDDYYGLLKDVYKDHNGEEYTGKNYEEWVKSIDYDYWVKRLAGLYIPQEAWREFLGLLGAPYKCMSVEDLADCGLFSDDEDIFESYMQKVGLYDLLSEEEEKTLLTRAVNGDWNATDKVLYANLRFTVSVANQYQNKGLSLIQLCDVSMQGLANAIKASASKPNDEKFIQFAVPFMHQAIEEEIADLEVREQEDELIISELIKEIFVKRGIEPENSIRYRCSKDVGEEILAEMNERCKELYSDEEIEKYREKYADDLRDDSLCELMLYLEGFDVEKEDDGYLFEASMGFYVVSDSSTGTYYWNNAGYSRK